jgi:hypothetical protein
VRPTWYWEVSAIVTPFVLFIAWCVLSGLKARASLLEGAQRWAAARIDMGEGTVAVLGEDGLESFGSQARRAGHDWLARAVSWGFVTAPRSVVALASRRFGVPVAVIQVELRSPKRVGKLIALKADGSVLEEPIDPEREPFPPPALARRLDALAARARVARRVAT